MSTRRDDSFDCIAFKRQVQEEVYEEIQDLTVEQRVQYFNEAARTGPFAKFWRRSATDADRCQPVAPSDAGE